MDRGSESQVQRYVDVTAVAVDDPGAYRDDLRCGSAHLPF